MSLNGFLNPWLYRHIKFRRRLPAYDTHPAYAVRFSENLEHRIQKVVGFAYRYFAIFQEKLIRKGMLWHTQALHANCRIWVNYV